VPSVERAGITSVKRAGWRHAPGSSGGHAPGYSLAEAHYRTIEVGGLEIFYREAGPAAAPVRTRSVGARCSCSAG